MNSPQSTANFNFSNVNDSQFLGVNDPRLSAQARQGSIGQSISTTGNQGQPNNQSVSGSYNGHLSFGQPVTQNKYTVTPRSTLPINIQPVNTPITIQPPQQQPQQQPLQPSHPKMNVYHRPQVYSGNYDQNINIKSSLQTIKQQQSSINQSMSQPSQIHMRSTQGYNLSQLQKQEYEKNKKLEQDSKCCFCFSKK